MVLRPLCDCYCQKYQRNSQPLSEAASLRVFRNATDLKGAMIHGGPQVSCGWADRACVGTADLGEAGDDDYCNRWYRCIRGLPAAAAAMQAQAKAAILAGTTPVAVEDTVKISAGAQEVQQVTAVRLLRNKGQSVPQIATHLKLAANAVQSYLGAQAAPQK